MKNKLFLYFLIGIISIPTYSQCLKGDCFNGSGSFRFSNGDLYSGEYKNGSQVGTGVYKWNNGDVYTGNFYNGYFDGYGLLKYASGQIDEGIWKNGVLVNNYEKPKTNELKSASSKNSGLIINKQEPELVGCISGNCIDGYGIYNFNNGDYYKGDYVNGYRTGKGYYKWSNGNQYEGDFLYNTQNGKGIFVWNNGDVYGGDFVNNALQGFGIYLFKNGDKYEGDWVSGVRQGQGKFTFASGIIKEGKWSNNIFIPSNTNNYKVAQDNISNSSSESTNVNNSQSTTNIMGDIQNEFEKISNNPLFKDSSSKLSQSGTNINGERCKKCKIVLKTPNNRACYICNRSFSGWGFRKDYYGITTEHKESLTPCYPYIGSHNYKDWTIYENACCSRQCAMKL